MSDFHIVLIFNEYYTQIVAVFDETDAEQKETCCKPTTILDFSVWPHYTLIRSKDGRAQGTRCKNTGDKDANHL